MKSVNDIKHTIDFVRPEENIEEWKVVLKYNNKEVALPFKVEKGAKMNGCSTERLLHFYFFDAKRASPYPTVEAFHKGYVPHFDVAKAKKFFDAIKSVEKALVDLFGDDYEDIEKQVEAFIEKEDEAEQI